MTDKQEFETVFRRHYDGMYRLALRLLGDEAESKDVVSDVFAQLLHSQTDLRTDTLHSYLLTLTHNRCINLLVHRQKEQQMQKAVMVEMATTRQPNRNCSAPFANASTCNCLPSRSRYSVCATNRD